MLTLDHRFDFNGHSIAWGAMGAGPPLVLIHGTPFNAQVWRRIAPVLAAHRRVYFYDLLGYGQSAMPDADVSLNVQNALLAALVEEWGLRKPEVLGHDFGGATALRAHFLDGVVYGRLTLVDPVAVAPWGSALVQHARAHADAFAGMPDYLHAALVDAYIRGGAHQPMAARTRDIYAAPWLSPGGKAAFYRQIAQMDQSQTDAVERLYTPRDFPVQILWGAEDRWIPLDRGEKLAGRLTGGELTVVPGAGHLVQEDRPEAIVAAVLAGATPPEQAA